MTAVQELPNDLSAEKAIFSVLLNNPERFIEVADLLVMTDFYNDNHQKLWEAMTILFREGQDIDMVTMRSQLRKQEVAVAPLLEALANCYDEEASENNLLLFIKEVKNKSMLRQIIRLSKLVTYNAQLENAVSSDLLKDLEADLLTIAEKMGEQKPIDAFGIVEEIKQEIIKNKDQKGFDTGFFELDELTGGLMPTHAWIVGAYTGIGKTFFILQLLLNVLKKGGKVALFSTEMDRKMNMLRMIGNLAGLGTISMIKGNLVPEDAEAMRIAQEKMASYQKDLFIFDNAYTVGDIRLKAKKLKVKYGLDVIAVDFIQNLRGGESIYERMAEAAVQLQQLAQEVEVTMIIGSQIPQDAANRKGGESIDYKGAGEIAAIADVGLWIVRRPDPLDVNNKGGRTVKIRKSRHGVPGEVKLDLEFPSGRFVDGKVETKGEGDVKDQI